MAQQYRFVQGDRTHGSYLQPIDDAGQDMAPQAAPTNGSGQPQNWVQPHSVGDYFKTLGKVASVAAPIVAAPFTGGLSLALIGGGSGALGGLLNGGGWKGALEGAGLGAIPGLGKMAGGAVTGALGRTALNAGIGAGSSALQGGGVKGALTGGALGGLGSNLTGGIDNNLERGLVNTGLSAGKGALTGGGQGALQGAESGALSNAFNFMPGSVPQPGKVATSPNLYSAAMGGGGNSMGVNWGNLINAGIGAAQGYSGGGGWTGAALGAGKGFLGQGQQQPQRPAGGGGNQPGGGTPPYAPPGTWMSLTGGGGGGGTPTYGNSSGSSLFGGGGGGNYSFGFQPDGSASNSYGAYDDAGNLVDTGGGAGTGAPSQEPWFDLGSGGSVVPAGGAYQGGPPGGASPRLAPVNPNMVNTPMSAPGTPITGNQPQTFWQKYGNAIFQGGAGVAGMIAAKKAQDAAQQLNPNQQAVWNGQQQVAGNAAGGAQQLYTQGQQLLSGPSNYYQALLSGNRAAMTQAVAPGIAALTDTYRGAIRGLDQAGVQGAQKAQAMSDLTRQRAGQIGSLITGVQPGAASALTGMGQNQLNLTPSLYQVGGGIYGTMGNQAYNQRVFANDVGTQTGSAIGQTVRDVGNALPGGNRPPAYQTAPPAPTGGTPTGGGLANPQIPRYPSYGSAQTPYA